MTQGGKLKSGLILTLGKLSGAVFGFARNIIIARIIGVEDYGIATVFAILVSVIELSGDLAFDRLIIQSEKGNDPDFQKGLQFLQALKGALIALLMFVLAGPISIFFGIEEVKWTIEVLSIAPLIRGFMHFDIYRFQRDLNFIPMSLVEVIAHFTAMVLAIPISQYFNDYRAPLCVSLLFMGLSVVISHIVAKRRYSWVISKPIFWNALQFGAPLVGNGILLSIVNQGDRALVGNVFSMTELGIYSVAFAITFLPTSVLSSIFLSYFLPLVSAVKSEKELLHEKAMLVTQLAALLGVVLVLGMVFLGPTLIIILYGGSYAASVEFIFLLAAMQSFRLAKVGPSTIAIGVGATSIPMLSNIFRVGSLLVAILLAYSGGTIKDIILAGLVGEMLSFVLSLWMISRKVEAKFSRSIGRLLPTMLVAGGASFIAIQYFDGSKLLSELLYGSFSFTCTCLASALLLPNVRIFALEKLRRFKN
jgi:O-antigen/teichoic acid export membrane protein